MKPKYLNNSGLSIIATVIVLLALALFAAVAVSLVTTGTGVGIQEERGIEAFYIAEGGMHYTLKLNTFPNYAVASTTLGNGQFIVSVPILAAGIDNSVGNITVSSSDSSVVPTDGFVKAPDGNYWIMLCDTASSATPNLSVSSDCEKINFTNKTATTFTVGTRGRDSSDAASHLQNAVLLMYSWDTTKNSTLSQTLVTGAKCTGASSKICIQSTDLTKFATTGSIRVHYDNGTGNNNEDIFYDGKGDNAGACGGCSACLGTNGCTRRALDYASGNGTTPHAAGATIYQSEFSALVTSRGVISGAILSGNIQRVLQNSVMPLQDP